MEIPGFSRGPCARGGRQCQQQKSSHMWNAVQLEGQWWFLDACWGAGTVDTESRLFVPRRDNLSPSTSGDMFLNTNGQGSIPDLGEGHPKPSCRPLSELPGLELSFQVHPQTPLADGPLLTTVVAREPRAKTDSLHITPITCNALLPELC